MSAMPKQKKILAVAVLSTALIQMCFFALTPAIARIQNEVFPYLSLSQIQTVMMAPSIISLVVSLIAAFLVNKGLISKKSVVVLGLLFLVLAGAVSFLLHTAFWHLIMLCGFVGIGAGLFIPSISSIMIDSFNEDERRVLSGYQTSLINLGGILLSTLAGFLISMVWFGGFITMLLALPIAVLVAIAIPKANKTKPAAQSEKAAAVKSKMPKDVYYYSFLAGLFLFFYIVSSSNISTHLFNAQIGNPAAAGVVTAITMGGGVLSGMFFNKLSSKFGDFLIAFAFIVLFIGFTVLNLGHSSLILIMVGSFIAGTSMSMITPQCLFSVSNIVDPSNSATATSLIVSIAPGIGGFLSPMIITNITTLLGGNSTNFRYQFVGFVALAVGLIVLYNTVRRQKLKESDAPDMDLVASKE
jgi:MFS family permease